MWFLFVWEFWCHSFESVFRSCECFQVGSKSVWQVGRGKPGWPLDRVWGPGLPDGAQVFIAILILSWSLLFSSQCHAYPPRICFQWNLFKCTGGNHSDWETIQGFDSLGFPVAEVQPTTTTPPTIYLIIWKHHIFLYFPVAKEQQSSNIKLQQEHQTYSHLFFEVSEDGSMVISKPPGTGGKVTVGTVAEQML